MNSRGHVRPRRYDSKLKRLKRDIPAITKSYNEHDEVENEIQGDKLEVGEFEKNLENDEDFEDHITSPAENSGEELPENKLIDFLKEKEESNLDDLIRILEVDENAEKCIIPLENILDLCL